MDKEEKKTEQKDEWWKETPIYVQPLPHQQTAQQVQAPSPKPSSRKKIIKTALICSALIYGAIILVGVLISAFTGFMNFSADPSLILFVQIFILLPIKIIWWLIKAIFSSIFASNYETGITKKGEFTVACYESHNLMYGYTTYQSLYLADDEESPVLCFDEVREKDRWKLTDFKALREGSADIYMERYEPSDRTSEFKVYHITCDGEKVTDFWEESITVDEFESAVGEDSVYREDNPKSLSDERLEKYKAKLKELGETEALALRATGVQIEKWEKENHFTICDEIKSILLFSNGFKYGSLEIYPLEKFEGVSEDAVHDTENNIVYYEYMKVGTVKIDGTEYDLRIFETGMGAVKYGVSRNWNGKALKLADYLDRELLGVYDSKTAVLVDKNPIMEKD